MRLTTKQYQVLYAIGQLKLPLVSSIAVLCKADRKDMAARLRILTSHGLVESRPYGTQRLMYMLTLAGSSVISKHLEKNTAPEIHVPAVPVPRVKEKVVIAPLPEGFALPRQIPIPKEVYVPTNDVHYRNDGNKHIRSLGSFQ